MYTKKNRERESDRETERENEKVAIKNILAKYYVTRGVPYQFFIRLYENK